MLSSFRRSLLLVSCALIVLSLVPAALISSPASAATPQRLDERLERWLFYRGMRACLSNNIDNTPLTSTDINDGQWGITGKNGFGYIAPRLDDGNDNDGTVSCDDGSIWVQGAKAFGFSDAIGLYCAIADGVTSVTKGSGKLSYDGQPCENSSNFKLAGLKPSIMQQALTNALDKTGLRPAFNINDNPDYKSMLYLIGARSLETFCGSGVPLADGVSKRTNDSNRVLVDIVTPDGDNKENQTYFLKGDRDENSKVDDIYYNQGGADNDAKDMRCHEMAKLTRDYSNDFKAWTKIHPDEASKIAADAQAQSSTPPGNDETTCAIDGIGWIICPVMNFMGRLNDAAYTFLQGFLSIRPSLITSEGTRNAWSAFRDFANVAFVIAFMVIVYSQLTSAGVSNYGIKKMLPRIIIAAILVNISFFICAIAVDISNIAGSSVYSLMKNIDIGSTIENAGWENQMSGILAGAAIGMGIILLAVMVLVAPTALLAFAVIIMILIARQAFIILLIVLSPLAFVAYLLPNTEDWFKKWWKALVAMLMVYPIIGLVFGASTLAANILNSTVESTENATLMQIIALGVLAVPLFAVPALLKGSLSAAGSIGTKIAGLADRSTRMSGKQLGNRASGLKKDLGNRFNIAANDPENKWGRRAGGYSRWKTRRDMGKRDRETAANRSAELGYASSMIETDKNGELTEKALKLQRAAAGGVGIANEKGQVRAQALATQRTFKQFDDDVSAFKTTQTSDKHEQLLQKAGNMSLSVEERAAAAGSIASRGYRGGHNDLLEQVHQQMAAADAAYLSATDPAEQQEAKEQVDKISAIQKQLKADLRENPFGLSNSAIGELGEGIYGRYTVKKGDNGQPVKDPSTGKLVIEKGPIANLKEDIKVRTGTKLTAQGLATMNPDDMSLVYSAAVSKDPKEQLNDDQLRNLVNKIRDARANNDTAVLIKPEASDKFDDILIQAAKRGITPATPSSQEGEPSGTA